MQKLILQNQWLKEYYIDASHRTQETIIHKAKDGRQTYTIKATESRVLIHSSLQMGKTYLLDTSKKPASSKCARIPRAARARIRITAAKAADRGRKWA